jgi:hypothetical protein
MTDTTNTLIWDNTTHLTAVASGEPKRYRRDCECHPTGPFRGSTGDHETIQLVAGAKTATVLRDLRDKRPRQAECLPHRISQVIDLPRWRRRFRLRSALLKAFFSSLLDLDNTETPAEASESRGILRYHCSLKKGIAQLRVPAYLRTVWNVPTWQ